MNSMLAGFVVRAGNMGFMLMPVQKPARTSNILIKDWLLAQAVHADNIRAAEVRSAEATELPVWKRPPVSVANGFCHPKGPRLARDDIVYSLLDLFQLTIPPSNICAFYLRQSA
jgi:hypothetical protein